MADKIIATRRGAYGQVRVTVPIVMKLAMLAFSKQLGMKKSEFLRLVLTSGFLAVSKSIPGGGEEAQGRSSGRADGERSAPSRHRGLS
jgi:hypothetical protein